MPHPDYMGDTMMAPAHVKDGDDRENRDELWTLYKLAVEDRNFQVTLNWDRTKHYFLFNVGVFSVAAGFARLPGTAAVVYFGLFSLVMLNAFFAAYSIWKGHTYYRESRRHQKELERKLGLAGTPLAVKTTRGMTRDTIRQEERTPADFLTITNLAIVLQVCIGIAAGAAIYLLGR